MKSTIITLSRVEPGVVGGPSLCGVPLLEAFTLKIKSPPGVAFWDFFGMSGWNGGTTAEQKGPELIFFLQGRVFIKEGGEKCG